MQVLGHPQASHACPESDLNDPVALTQWSGGDQGAKGARRAYLLRPIRFGREGHHPAYGAGHGHPGPSSARWRPVQTVKSLLPTPIAVMKEREEARALRTDRGERLAVRRSPTRFRCAFFGPSQLHARRSGRCAGGGVAPIALASGAKLRACQVRTAAAQIAPGGAKCDFSPSDAK